MAERVDPVLSPLPSSEAKAIETMARTIWPSAYSQIIAAEQIEYMLGWMYSPEKICTEIERDGVAWFWIKSRGKRIGFLSGGPLSDDLDFPLHKIYLLPERQGEHFGSHSMNELFVYVEALGGKRISLRVNRENTIALNFYERKGFQLTGMDQADIGGGFIMDDYLLTKPL